MTSFVVDMYYETFAPHVPVIHKSWDSNTKAPILTEIMLGESQKSISIEIQLIFHNTIACGALAVKSSAASDFLTRAWDAASELLSFELVSMILSTR